MEDSSAYKRPVEVETEKVWRHKGWTSWQTDLEPEYKNGGNPGTGKDRGPNRAGRTNFGEPWVEAPAFPFLKAQM